MKIYLLLIGSGLIASGCGTNGIHHGGSAVGAPKKIILTKLEGTDLPKSEQSITARGYTSLGRFQMTSLPPNLAKLPDGSAIGTLNLELEEENYQNEYSGEVVSQRHKTERKLDTQVYLLRESTSPDEVIFGLMRDEAAIQLTPKETPITVCSKPREYCSQIHHFGEPLSPVLSIIPQDAVCDPAGFCDVKTYWNAPPGFEGLAKLNLGAAHPGVCLCKNTAINYDHCEAKMNIVTPIQATVVLDHPDSKPGTEITFGL